MASNTQLQLEPNTREKLVLSRPSDSRGWEETVLNRLSAQLTLLCAGFFRGLKLKMWGIRHVCGRSWLRFFFFNPPVCTRLT